MTTGRGNRRRAIARQPRYMCKESQRPIMSVHLPVRLKATSLLPVFAALAAIILIGAALGAWLGLGPQMLLTMGQQALAWCF